MENAYLIIVPGGHLDLLLGNIGKTGVTRGDYERAGIPMLPVAAGETATRRQILLYAVVLWPVTLLPWVIGMSGPLYGGVAFLLGGIFVLHAVAVVYDGGHAGAKRAFGFSILYLFSLFLALIVDRASGLVG